MDVDDIVFQIKRRGTFDELRKQLYTDVLNHVSCNETQRERKTTHSFLPMQQLGQAFIERVNTYASQAIERDPSLTTKSSAAFQAIIMGELERYKIKFRCRLLYMQIINPYIPIFPIIRAGLFEDLKQQILKKLLDSDYYDKRTEEAIQNVMRQG